jgi:prolyl-tRNA synthetase
VIADTGEDAIAYCPAFELRGQRRACRGAGADGARGAPTEALHKTPTPGKTTCEDVAALLGLPLARTVKSLMLAVDNASPAGDRCARRDGCCSCAATTQLNEVKAGKVAGLRASASRPRRDRKPLRLPPGYLGPVGIPKDGDGGGRSHGGRDERFRLRRQRGRISTTPA